MKQTYLCFILTLGVLFSCLPSAKADTAQSLETRTVFDCCTVMQNAWTSLVASSAKQIRGLAIFNSGTVGMLVATGAVGSEAARLIVPASTNPQMVFYPLHLSSGTNISVKALGSTGSVGEFQVNYLYF